jgi:hypothetical protein
MQKKSHTLKMNFFLFKMDGQDFLEKLAAEQLLVELKS